MHTASLKQFAPVAVTGAVLCSAIWILLVLFWAILTTSLWAFDFFVHGFPKIPLDISSTHLKTILFPNSRQMPVSRPIGFGMRTRTHDKPSSALAPAVSILLQQAGKRKRACRLFFTDGKPFGMLITCCFVCLMRSCVPWFRTLWTRAKAYISVLPQRSWDRQADSPVGCPAPDRT